MSHRRNTQMAVSKTQYFMNNLLQTSNSKELVELAEHDPDGLKEKITLAIAGLEIISGINDKIVRLADALGTVLQTLGSENLNQERFSKIMDGFRVKAQKILG